MFAAAHESSQASQQLVTFSDLCPLTTLIILITGPHPETGLSHRAEQAKVALQHMMFYRSFII